MKTSDILLAAAVIAVGVVVYRAMQPAQASATPTSGASSGGSISAILGGAAAALGTVGAVRLGEAISGERAWW